MSSRITKRLIYQQTVWQLPTTISLSDYLALALTSVPHVERRQPVSEDATDSTGTWRWLTYAVTEAGTVCGKLCEYTHGSKQGTVRVRYSEDPTIATPEGAAAAPLGEEFATSTLFFCVDGNHVAVAQSQGLRIGQLELFLNWFLRTKAQLLPPNNWVALESLVSAEARTILNTTTPTAITFSRPVQIAEPPNAIFGQPPRVNAALASLASLLNVADVQRELGPAALVDGRIKASLTFAWNQQVGGRHPEEALQALGRVAIRALDEDPDVEAKIVTPLGDLTREKLSLTEKLSFTMSDGVVQTRDVFDAMLRFLRRLQTRGDVTD